jgi:hypothetical protein
LALSIRARESDSRDVATETPMSGVQTERSMTKTAPWKASNVAGSPSINTTVVKTPEKRSPRVFSPRFAPLSVLPNALAKNVGRMDAEVFVGFAT